MSLLVRYGLLTALIAAALLAAGCGKTVVDDAKTEDAIEQNLKSSGNKVTAVECPAGVEVETDATFDCAVTLAGGKEATARMKILNDEADIELTNLKAGK
jgi:Flp pilus assembly pilin Flp